MRHITRVVLAGLSTSPWLHAAAQAVPSATAAATVAARPSDVASVDAIIAALYDANTILADQKRDADRFRSLFVPGARLMPTSGSGNGPQVIRILTVEDYVQRASSGPPRHGFSEREIVRTSEAFGNIVHVFSTYEMHRDSTDAHPARGINSIQLFNDGARWWVVGLLWDTERPDKPIPPEFLPRRPVIAVATHRRAPTRAPSLRLGDAPGTARRRGCESRGRGVRPRTRACACQ